MWKITQLVRSPVGTAVPVDMAVVLQMRVQEPEGGDCIRGASRGCIHCSVHTGMPVVPLPRKHEKCPSWGAFSPRAL